MKKYYKINVKVSPFSVSSSTLKKEKDKDYYNSIIAVGINNGETQIFKMKLKTTKPLRLMS